MAKLSRLQDLMPSSLRAFFLLAMLLFSTVSLMGQVSIQEPASLTRMIRQFSAKNKEVTMTKAWTIQVAASTDRREVERERGRFGRVFPQHRLEWVHDDPYYLLKMKDIAFVQKRDALHLLHQIKDRYRASAILVLEDVPPEKLLQSL